MVRREVTSRNNRLAASCALKCEWRTEHAQKALQPDRRRKAFSARLLAYMRDSTQRLRPRDRRLALLLLCA